MPLRPASFEAQGRDLLGDEPDQDDHDRKQRQHHGPVWNARVTGEVPGAVRGGQRRTTARGAKMRSGLKMVTIFSKISRNLAPSLASRIFEAPRGRARQSA